MKESLTDIYSSIKSWHLWTTLGWLELRQRYKRSIVGPFWITLSMAVLIIALGVIYGELFKLEVKEYLPMLAVGLVFWNFISGVIN
ncbi:TPA: O89/O101/O162 family O-antigen export ABC transporter permease subunit, partial [Escherichia coli]|nr:O89/O101/O162 family O-antigen export ABC transporter permease subunit [Escherichia coli]